MHYDVWCNLRNQFTPSHRACQVLNWTKDFFFNELSLFIIFTCNAMVNISAYVFIPLNLSWNVSIKWKVKFTRKGSPFINGRNSVIGIFDKLKWFIGKIVFEGLMHFHPNILSSWQFWRNLEEMIWMVYGVTVVCAYLGSRSISSMCMTHDECD